MPNVTPWWSSRFTSWPQGDCGCGRWDSLCPLYACLHWLLAALSQGTMPEARHDQTPWRSEDEQRRALQGKPMGFRAVVADICGDEAEIALRWDFATWSSSLSPCFRCNATLTQIRSCENHASLWTRRTTADCVCECDRSEIWVALQNEAVHREVRFKLKNSTVGKGKCLASDIPELGLREGDRLEPSATMMDTGRFDDQSTFPVIVWFWRAPLQPTVHKRHPILDVALGTGVVTFSLDILRTLHLGVFQYWILRAVW